MLERLQPNARNSHATKKKSKGKPKQIDALKKMNSPLAMKMPEGIGDEDQRQNQKKMEDCSEFWVRRADHADPNGTDTEDGDSYAMERNGNAMGERRSLRGGTKINKTRNQRHRRGHQPEHHCSLESKHGTR